MTTVSAQTTGTYTFNNGESVTVTTDPGESAHLKVTSAAGVLKAQFPITGTRTVGPFAAGDLMTLTAVRGDVDYTTAYTVFPSNSAVTTTVTLTGAYTLSASDDGTWFTSNTSVVVTVPAGLSPMPACVFIPPASGSITLRSSGGTKLSGATNDIVVNLSTNPSGAGLVPLYGQTDSYGVTVAATSFASLTGAPTDNTAFNTWAAGYLAAPPGGAKLSANYTVQASDHGAFIWMAAQATDKIITFPTSLPNNFRCFIGYVNNTAAAGRLKLTASGTSATFVYSASAADGTLVSNANVFMGTASANSIATCAVFHEGSQPGTTFQIARMGGAFSAT